MGESRPSEEAIALFTNVFGYSPDPEALHAGECWQAERIDAALRRAKAEGALVWTSEKPTVEGVYWYRNNGNAASVVQVYEHHDDGWCVYGLEIQHCSMRSLERDEYDELTEGEWAGPLSAPLDARAAQIEEGSK